MTDKIVKTGEGAGAENLEILQAARAEQEENKKVKVSQAEDIEIDAASKAETEEVAKQLEKKLISLDAEGVDKATKKEKKSLYSSESVMPIGTNLETKRTSDSLYETFLELNESLVLKRPLTGTIASSFIYGNHPTAVIQYNEYKVLIPIEELLTKIPSDDEIKGDAQAKLNYKKLLVDYRLCTEVDFIVTAIDEANKLAVASRRQAMRSIATAYYLTKAKGTSHYPLNQGQLAEARVVNVTPYHLTVEVFGIECDIKPEEISYTRSVDLTDEYQQGDKVIVRFLVLERNQHEVNGKKHTGLKVAVSIKQAKEDPRDALLRVYEVGSKSVGVVTVKTEFGYFVRLGGTQGQIDALCTAGSLRGALPKSGDRVIVNIINKDVESKRLVGSIVRLMK